MTADDYLRALGSGTPVGRVTEAPWDSRLVDAMREHTAKVDLRPGFALDVLLDAPARELIEVLGWFHVAAGDGRPAAGDVS